MNRRIAAVAYALREHLPVMALTGAGISVPSGIPDFRSPGGLWTRYDPFVEGSIAGFLEDPERSWRMFDELRRTCLAADPNPAHLALARMEAAGILAGIVTQNVDGLHRRAGSRAVVCFHGEGERLGCLSCGFEREWGREDIPPRCPRCGGALKPDIVLFGEEIPRGALEDSEAMLGRAGSLLVVGTSAEVWPASDIPRRALHLGRLVVEINVRPTALAREPGVMLLAGGAESVLPGLADALDCERRAPRKDTT